MTVSEETAQKAIERAKRSIKEAKWELENLDSSKEQLSRTHSSIGDDLRRIGLYKLLLGELSSSEEKFEEATRKKLLKYNYKSEYELEEYGRTCWQTQMSVLEEVLYTALLARNDELTQKVVAEVTKLDSAYKNEYPKTVYCYYHVKALANVAIDSASQKEYIDALRESVADEDAHLQQYFGAVAAILDGIRIGDETRVEDGLITLLDRHAEKREGKRSSLRDHVSRRPLALFLLARKRGLEIDIDSQYIPDTVL